MGSCLQTRVPQRFVADDPHCRGHVRSDGFYDAVRLSRSQAGLSLQPVGDGRCRRRHRLCTQLLRLRRASLLYRSASAGRTDANIDKLLPVPCVRSAQPKRAFSLTPSHALARVRTSSTAVDGGCRCQRERYSEILRPSPRSHAFERVQKWSTTSVRTLFNFFSAYIESAFCRP